MFVGNCCLLMGLVRDCSELGGGCKLSFPTWFWFGAIISFMLRYWKA